MQVKNAPTLFQTSLFNELNKFLDVRRQQLGFFKGSEVTTARHDFVRDDVLELVFQKVFRVHEQFFREHGRPIGHVGRDPDSGKTENQNHAD